LDAFNNNAMCNLTLSETKKIATYFDFRWWTRQNLILQTSKQKRNCDDMCKATGDLIDGHVPLAFPENSEVHTSCLMTIDNAFHKCHMRTNFRRSFDTWVVSEGGCIGHLRSGMSAVVFQIELRGCITIGWRWCTKPTIWKRMLLYPL
jgi:hypothetical protein